MTLSLIDSFRIGQNCDLDKQQPPSRDDNPEAGFSLVEMLVVLAIIGLLVSLVAPKVFNVLAGAKQKTAQIQLESFVNGLDLFAIDVGRYPSTAEGLLALYAKPGSATHWNGPYLRGNSVPTDPWGNAYIYRSPGQERSNLTGNRNPFEIMSLGSNGQEGGSGDAEDIKSWKK